MTYPTLIVFYCLVCFWLTANSTWWGNLRTFIHQKRIYATKTNKMHTFCH